jgi:hypothetical protein
MKLLFKKMVSFGALYILLLMIQAFYFNNIDKNRLVSWGLSGFRLWCILQDYRPQWRDSNNNHVSGDTS